MGFPLSLGKEVVSDMYLSRPERATAMLKENCLNLEHLAIAIDT